MEGWLSQQGELKERKQCRKVPEPINPPLGWTKKTYRKKEGGEKNEKTMNKEKLGKGGGETLIAKSTDDGYINHDRWSRTPVYRTSGQLQKKKITSW